MDWDLRPSLEGAVFGCEKGLPDPYYSPRAMAVGFQEAQYERDLADATVVAVATFVPDATSTQAGSIDPGAVSAQAELTNAEIWTCACGQF